MKIFLIVLVTALTACQVTETVPLKEDPIKKAYKSVVRLRTAHITDGTSYIASGFAVSKKYIMTANHFCSISNLGQVLGSRKPTEMHIVNNNGELELKGPLTIVDLHVKEDICVLEKRNHGVIPLKFVPNYGKVKIGDNLSIIGNPHGHFPSRSDGYVVNRFSAVWYKKGKRMKAFINRLVVSAAITGGSSGAPVLNSKGEVLGMIILKDPHVGSTYQHVGFATTAKSLKRFLKTLGK